MNTTSRIVLSSLQIKNKNDLYYELRDSKEKLSLVITLLKKKPYVIYNNYKFQAKKITNIKVTVIAGVQTLTT